MGTMARQRPLYAILRACEGYFHRFAHSRICGIQLQVECCRLDSFLFISGKLGKAVGKGVSDAELH